QEGAYVVAGAALGLPPDLALGLSLLKRARDVVLGIPALAAWHLLELRTAWRRQGRRRTARIGERPIVGSAAIRSHIGCGASPVSTVDLRVSFGDTPDLSDIRPLTDSRSGGSGRADGEGRAPHEERQS